MNEYAQWGGCLFGVAGSFLLATNSRYSGYGFVAFLVSNAHWIVYGTLTGSTALVLMQVAFTATSLLGIYRWLSPKRRGTFARESAGRAA